jgi:ribose transport system permease protein
MSEQAQEMRADQAAAPELPRRRGGIGSGSTALWILVIDVALIVLFGLLSDGHSFWNVGSFQNLGSDAAEALILAMAISLLLGAGEFDISLGATLLLASVFGGQLATKLAGSGTAVAAVAALCLCVAVGAVVGLLNGTVVTRLRVNSLIATLAMLGIATGVANIVTKGTDLGNVPASLQDDFGIRTIASVPLPAFVALAVWAVAWVTLRTTRFGLRLVALGSSRGAAERSGMRVDRHLLVAFVIVGALAGLAGFIDLTRFATTNLAGHQNDALAALTAAVIGGTSLFGGHISMGGVLSGTLLAVVLQDGLVVVGLSAFYQLIAVGVVLIAAVYLDQRRRPGGLRLAGRT